MKSSCPTCLSVHGPLADTRLCDRDVAEAFGALGLSRDAVISVLYQKAERAYVLGIYKLRDERWVSVESHDGDFKLRAGDEHTMALRAMTWLGQEGEEY